jgi:hypothetical protein
MAKEFTEVEFDPARFKAELDSFRGLLESKAELGEEEIRAFLQHSAHLTAAIGTTSGNIGVAKRFAHEFPILGDYRADIVLGNSEHQFCFVELEDGKPDSVLKRVPGRATKEWARGFERGFSQIVDWFCQLDGFKHTPRFQDDFGYGHIDFVGLLLIGRAKGLEDDDLRRLRWRRHHVVVNSHHVFCMTYDDLYRELDTTGTRYSTLLGAGTTPPPGAGGTLG